MLEYLDSWRKFFYSYFILNKRGKLFLGVCLLVSLGKAQHIQIQAPSNFQEPEVIIRAFSVSEQEYIAKQSLNSSEWAQFLRVYTGNPDSLDSEKPAIWGKYHLRGNQLYFIPHFPWKANFDYWILWDARAWAQAQGKEPSRVKNRQKSFRVKSEALSLSPPKILKISPLSDTLAANQLRLYLHFSESMQNGRAREFIELCGAQGESLPPAFLPIPQELWDEQNQRLTLFFDPGRIKRNLRPNQEGGSPLKAGNVYYLKIKKGWPSQSKGILQESFVKKFWVKAPDRERPDPKTWLFIYPKAQTKEVLKIIFPEALDAALAQRLIRVQGPKGTLIPGKVHLADQERVWIFSPTQSWSKGNYQIQVHPRLEDLAGNSLKRLFDQEQGSNSKVFSGKYYDIPFRLN